VATAPQESLAASLPSGLGLFEKLEQRVAHLESLIDSNGPNGGPREKLNGKKQYGNRSTANYLQSRDNDYHARRLDISRQRLAASVFPDAANFMRQFGTEGLIRDPRVRKVVDDLRCLHYSLKQYHKRPVLPASCVGLMQILPLIPPAHVCHVLTELYFDNLEHCFRILHKPTFVRQRNHFFESSEPVSDTAFVPQMVAVISMATLMGTRSECLDVLKMEQGRLIDSSVAYIQDYLSSLSSKRLYTISALQIKMLLLVLRWLRLDKHNDLWRLSGDTLRHALIMNMDKDPSEIDPSMSPLQAELRRRAWTTIVEVDLMMSILRNMPCLVPDFTCRAPLNINDDELSDNDTVPASRPREEWTDSLCQTVLADSISDRIHACRDLKSTRSIQYEHVLEHTRSFEKILDNLPGPLRFSHQDNIASAPARLMARMEMDITIRRPLMHLYSPFAHANNEHDEFSEARAGYLQSCLMLDVYQDLFDPKFSELGVQRPEGYWDFFYNSYRSELHQAVAGICLELKRIASSGQLDTPIASSSLLKTNTYNRASLIHAIKDSLEPMVRRISHLGSDLKELTYLTIVFHSIKSAQFDFRSVIEALEELAMACRLQLERSGIPIYWAQDGLPTDSGSGWTPGPGNDVSWSDLADLPLEFDYGNDINFDMA
jgi:hypothetical protein